MTDLGAVSDPGARRRVWIASLLFVGLYFAFAAFSVLIYRGSMTGPWISDDSTVIVSNPYLTLPIRDLIPEAFAPSGDARRFLSGNYAPVVHLAHALEGRLFRSDMRGYHGVNILVHALNAVLLCALLLRAGLARAVCLTGSALFLLHPANVEPVAWISQLRTLLSLAGALLALLLLRRAPLLSAACFATGLLTKASASMVLPMAAVFLYAEYRRGLPIRRPALGLALWLVALAVYAPIQLPVFSTMARAYGDPYPDWWIHLRSIAAIGARYLAMAATGYGVSGYHEPEPVHSVLDPWWLAGMAAASCIGVRVARTLRRADPEAGWWLGAAAAFAPISQFLPFMFPMGDRYLYFMLPGLIGGTGLALSELYERMAARLRRNGRAGLLPWLHRTALAGALLWAAVFAFHARARTHLWQGEGYLLEDAALQYPNGAVGHYVRAVHALERRDSDTALEELRASAARGGGMSHSFYGDPFLTPLQGDPRFQQLLKDIAQIGIDGARESPVNTQSQLYSVGSAHYLRGELDEAIAKLEEAARLGGPLQDQTVMLLERIRLERSGKLQTGPFSSAPPAGAKPTYDFPSGRKLAADEWPEP